MFMLAIDLCFTYLSLVLFLNTVWSHELVSRTCRPVHEGKLKMEIIKGENKYECGDFMRDIQGENQQ